MPTSTLYVVFHGTVSLIEYSDHFRAILISMEEHRVAVGNFLTERTVPKGTALKLTGVALDGTGSLDRKKNIVLDVSRLDEVAISLYGYAEIFLPKPKKIHSLRTGLWRDEDLTGTTRGELRSRAYSAVQVFEYSVERLKDVRVSGRGFVPWYGSAPRYAETDTPEEQYCSFHVFSEPETDPGMDHMTEEFNRCSRILGIDLRLVVPLHFPQLESLPPGMRKEETLSLERRVMPVLNLVAGINSVDEIIAAGDNEFCGGSNAVYRG